MKANDCPKYWKLKHFWSASVRLDIWALTSTLKSLHVQYKIDRCTKTKCIICNTRFISFCSLKILTLYWEEEKRFMMKEWLMFFHIFFYNGSNVIKPQEFFFLTVQLSQWGLATFTHMNTSLGGFRRTSTVSPNPHETSFRSFTTQWDGCNSGTIKEVNTCTRLHTTGIRWDWEKSRWPEISLAVAFGNWTKKYTCRDELWWRKKQKCM